MALVPKDEMTTLRTAAQSAETAQTGEDAIQLNAVAYAINNAANTGLYEVTFQDKLRDSVATQLTGKGYKIRYTGNIYDMDRHAIISWKQG